jgi:hypothetical protein
MADLTRVSFWEYYGDGSLAVESLPILPSCMPLRDAMTR